MDKLMGTGIVSGGVGGVLVVLGVFALSFFSDVTVSRISNEFGSTDEAQEGVTFYRPWPHLLITQEPGPPETRSVQVVMLPDLSREYLIEWRNLIGSGGPNVSLADGWNLTAFGDTTASGVPETLGPLVPRASGGGGDRNSSSNEEALTSGLYRLEWKDGKWALGDKVF